MSPRLLLVTVTVGAALAFNGGCRDRDAAATSHPAGPEDGTGKAEREHDQHHEHEHGGVEKGSDSAATVSGLAFETGKGLRLPDATARALGLETVLVEKRALSHRVQLTGQVFDQGPPARVSVTLPVTAARELASHDFGGARLLKLDDRTNASTGRAELLFSVEGVTARVGAFVALDLLAEGGMPSIVVPSNALLRAADGDFVYRVEGDYLRRVPVTIHAHTDAAIEVTAGLAAGDRIIAGAVEKLWLTELRLTKGGGHSH